MGHHRDKILPKSVLGIKKSVALWAIIEIVVKELGCRLKVRRDISFLAVHFAVSAAHSKAPYAIGAEQIFLSQ